ncbi:YqgE/AlgH family protein [Buchnera aphidicola (Ceratoglyphina bambusae)]|uniref:YqgE/AlgH family protein n=1 Tax=Buchnera aphidicola TaxID=9 RepID=UPI0031B82D84
MKLILQNHFLIAMPGIEDPFFKKSVIYICKHDSNGTMGIIINKPIENLKIKDILKKLKIKDFKKKNKEINKPVILGGPQSGDRGFILHSSKKKFSTSIKVSKNMLITTSRDILESIESLEDPENILVALGYCSWKKNQLENELLENTWIITPASNYILFKVPMKNRWTEAAKTLGIDTKKITMNFGNA